MSLGVRANIEDFLSYRRLAMVGVSRDPKDFSRALFRELRSRGYDIVPVNPNANEVEGERCYARLAEIHPGVDGAFVMTHGTATDNVVKDCADAGVSRVWLHRGTGKGSVTDTAVRFCRDHSITVVPGECPFMFLSGGSWVHGAHRFCRKLVGKFPD